MKSLSLKIVINCPASKIFEFTADPSNTPKWIDFVAVEKINTDKPKLGTIYRNSGKDGEWREYKMTEYHKNRHFSLEDQASGYNVRYTFNPLGKNKTEFEYFEWMDDGELDEPFEMKYLDKLKSILESKTE